MPDPTYGKITDEKLAQLKSRIGIEVDEANFEPVTETDAHNWKPRYTGFNHEVTPDAIRHFVEGYGDDNPLYCDGEAAAETMWQGQIAPPTFIWSMYLNPDEKSMTLGGGDEAPRYLTVEARQRLEGDPIRGTGALQSNLEYEFYNPLRPGDRLFTKRALLSVKDKSSAWGGRAVHVTWGVVSWNQRREIIHLQRGTWVRAERRERSDEKQIQPAPDPYTDEQLAEIDAAYASEVRRGSTTRYFEDVVVGEELALRVKGPLRVTDLIVFHGGFGQAFLTKAFRLGYEVRQDSPGLYSRNSLNIPDIVQRMHWDPEWAAKVGAAACYDYGALRETWLCQLVNDWAGDDSWISGLNAQHRKFNYIGDTTWLKGRVASKTQFDDRAEVLLDVWCENQRGMITSPAQATVILPSKMTGVVLPKPVVADPIDLLRSEIARLRDLDEVDGQ
jgi:acyl dehydratase